MGTTYRILSYDQTPTFILETNIGLGASVKAHKRIYLNLNFGIGQDVLFQTQQEVPNLTYTDVTFDGISKYLHFGIQYMLRNSDSD